jgi:SAM-dependent methyltransferase
MDADEGGSRSLDVLDAGCGTGCAGRSSRRMPALVGVDLSERMIEQARARNVYDELVRCELTAYLHDHAAAFDVIVSADTLVYFGPLEEASRLPETRLRAGGRFVFTVEELSGAGRAAIIRSARTGAIAMRAGTSRRVLAEASLQSEIVPAELRLEAGEPVPGLVGARNERGSGPRVRVIDARRCSGSLSFEPPDLRPEPARQLERDRRLVRAIRRKARRGSFITCSSPVATTVADLGTPSRRPARRSSPRCGVAGQRASPRAFAEPLRMT